LCLYIGRGHKPCQDTEENAKSGKFKQQIWIEERIKKFRKILEIQDFRESNLENSWRKLKKGIKATT